MVRGPTTTNSPPKVKKDHSKDSRPNLTSKIWCVDDSPFKHTVAYCFWNNIILQYNNAVFKLPVSKDLTHQADQYYHIVSLCSSVWLHFSIVSCCILRYEVLWDRLSYWSVFVQHLAREGGRRKGGAEARSWSVSRGCVMMHMIWAHWAKKGNLLLQQKQLVYSRKELVLCI